MENKTEEIKMEGNNFEKPRIEEGLYPAVLKNIKDVAVGPYGPRLAIEFDLPTAGIELSTIVYAKATPGSKLTAIYEACGFKFNEGENIVLKNLIGKACRVLVEDWERDGVLQSGITKVKSALELEQEVVEDAVGEVENTSEKKVEATPSS